MDSDPTPDVPPPRLTAADFLGHFLEILQLAKRQIDDPGVALAWHAIIVPDTAPSRSEHFASLEALVARLRALRQEGAQQVWAYQGQPFGISKGGNYLVTPQGRIPLFVADERDEIDPTGFLGAQPAFSGPAGPPADDPDDRDEDDDFDDEVDDEGDD